MGLRVDSVRSPGRSRELESKRLWSRRLNWILGTKRFKISSQSQESRQLDSTTIRTHKIERWMMYFLLGLAHNSSVELIKIYLFEPEHATNKQCQACRSFFMSDERTPTYKHIHRCRSLCWFSRTNQPAIWGYVLHSVQTFHKTNSEMTFQFPKNNEF